MKKQWIYTKPEQVKNKYIRQIDMEHFVGLLIIMEILQLYREVLKIVMEKDLRLDAIE